MRKWIDLFETFTPEQIAYLVNRQVKTFADTPQEINNGWCFGFASKLARRLGAGAKVVSTTGHEGVFPGHTVVEYHGRYYDAESPEGVSDMRDLAYSVRMKRFRDDVSIEDSRDGLLYGKLEETQLNEYGTYLKYGHRVDGDNKLWFIDKRGKLSIHPLTDRDRDPEAAGAGHDRFFNELGWATGRIDPSQKTITVAPFGELSLPASRKAILVKKFSRLYPDYAIKYWGSDASGVDLRYVAESLSRRRDHRPDVAKRT